MLDFLSKVTYHYYACTYVVYCTRRGRMFNMLMILSATSPNRIIYSTGCTGTLYLNIPVYTVYIRLAGFGDTRDTWSFISEPCYPRTKDMTDVGLRPDCE